MSTDNLQFENLQSLNSKWADKAQPANLSELFQMIHIAPVVICPLCSRRLLRHVGRNRLYWYCTTCRQAMPVTAKDNLCTTDRFTLALASR